MNIEEKEHSVEVQVLKLIESQTGAPVDKLEGDTVLFDLGMDELDKVEFIMGLEEQFDIEIPDAHADELNTVRDVINYIFRD